MSIELYTQYGAGWTGQLGTFTPNCNGNGICVYLVPNNINSYQAVEGEVEIVTLPEVDDIESSIGITSTVSIGLNNLTLRPVPGTNAPGCFHVDDTFLVVFLDKSESD
ncbi:MAG: hypothetical protein GY805_13985 [Chloroflexi bacterium]|nr:hypothetical protein [Chloroflexota bacterium]